MLITRSAAISEFDRPAPIIASTSRSRSLRSAKPGGAAVAVRLAVSGVPAGSVATLKGPAQATYGAAAADAGGSLVLDGLVPGGTAFVRAEVRRDAQPTSAMVALTNPIFLS